MSITVKLIEKIHDKEVETMTQWMYEWWGQKQNNSYECIKSYMIHSIHKDQFPYTFGLYLDDLLIGMYQFRLEDLFTRPDLYPWLANVYISPQYRHQGYGHILMNSIKINMQTYLSSSTLYLYTTHCHLYEKYGWTYVCNIDTFLDNDRIQRLYQFNINK